MPYVQAGIAIQNPQAFGKLKDAIDVQFEAIARFLRRVENGRLRIRDFSGILERELLQSPGALETYAELEASDQGQIREYYLTRLEQVDPAVRKKFLKLYSYY
jgi:hypothetical protein